MTQITTTIVNAKMRNWVIVRVFTDVPGLVGIGEATVGVPEINNGFIYPPSAPGIGVDINEIEASKHPFESVNPVQWFNNDGSTADW